MATVSQKSNSSKRYDRELKSGAVKLILEEGRSYSQVAASLGVSEPSVRQWVQSFKMKHEDAFPGSGKRSGQDEEIRRLKEELRITRMERDILKKTIGFFAERPK
jgi:transposase